MQDSILIVEDDYSIRETLKLALELEGYQVYTANDGKEGLVALSRIPSPCLILLDLMMPVMNGWVFMKEVARDVVCSKIPIVVITAFSYNPTELGTKEVLKKPLDMEHFYQVVRNYCNHGEPANRPA